MYYVYVLKSSKTGLLYKGQTDNLERRVQEHNAGKTSSTRHGIPWNICYYEKHESRDAAITREKYFKTLRGGKELKKIMARM